MKLTNVDNLFTYNFYNYIPETYSVISSDAGELVSKHILTPVTRQMFASNWTKGSIDGFTMVYMCSYGIAHSCHNMSLTMARSQHENMERNYRNWNWDDNTTAEIIS